MIRGSCHCGAVAWETTALTSEPTHCHCRTCRKTHSAAYNTSARTNRADFRWTRGADVVADYESTPGKVRHFCPRCGAHLMAHWRKHDEVVLRLGSVDEGLEVMPVGRIWVSDAAPWALPDDGLPRYDGYKPVG